VENSGEKISYMDGLRGLAALVVVFHHYALAYFYRVVFGNMNGGWSNAIYSTPLSLLVAGRLAVCVFFVISGYVLSYKYFRSQKPEILTSAAIRRYFRLMPPILVTTLLSYALIKLHAMHNVHAAQITHSPWLAAWWLGAAHLGDALKLGLYDVFVSQAHYEQYNNALWTMQIELIGSFLVFGFLALFGQIRRRWVVYGLLAMLLWRTYYPAFLIGMALSDWSAGEHRRGRRLSSPGGLWLIALGLLLGSAPQPGPVPSLVGGLTQNVVAGDLGFTLFQICAAGLIVSGLVLTPKAQALLGRRPMRYLGRISFSLYLVHLLVLASLSAGLFLLMQPHLGYKVSAGVSFLVSLVVTLGLAEVLTVWVDRPAIRWSGKIYRRFFTGEPPVREQSPPAAVVTSFPSRGTFDLSE
jgi:peptidoglycan/LPS O-acetylase OafA/YrhL